MKKLNNLTVLFLTAVLFSCSHVKTKESSSEILSERPTDSSEPEICMLADAKETASSSKRQAQPQPEPGLLTAGEWNDIDSITYWKKLLQSQEYAEKIASWNLKTDKPVVVELKNPSGLPVCNAVVELKHDGETLFSTKSDNRGIAIVWLNVLGKESYPKLETLKIHINSNEKVISDLQTTKTIPTIIQSSTAAKDIEIAFMVDATGSMGDEMEFLKVELLDVIKNIQAARPESSIKTASLFYRDHDDEYLTKSSPFSNNPKNTLAFIKDQYADGGGDFPEAVETALDKSLNDLQWSSSTKTKILFMLLDAPPHSDPQVISSLQKSILKASQQGIKLIPITASGIDKETEFLMRQMAQISNGTYIFITDDSGIGNSHLTPTVGQYQVEKLNKLMEKIILKYSA